MSHRFTYRVAVVTGASSGIGRATAQRLAAEGAKVGLIARRREPLEKLAAEIRAAGGAAAVAVADVANRDELHAAIGAVREQLGPIDLLLANAGVGTPTLLDPVNIADVEQTFRVNVLGVIYAIEAVLPEMLARKSGQIAAVSSLAADRGLPGESAYCASKAAVNVYLDGLRAHLRGRGVSVTTLCPGFVQTPMTAVNDFAMPFLLTAEQAAARIVSALARRRAVYRFPWRMAVLMRLVARLPDWLLVKVMHDYNEAPPMNNLQKPG